jgi:hypothetical protein
MHALNDGRFRLEREGVIAYKSLNGTVGMAHARLYEARDQAPVVIVGEPEDNPGMSVTNTIETIAATIARDWFKDDREFVLLAYDVDGQTFSEASFESGADPTPARFRNPHWQFVSILDVLGVMPQLFNVGDYTIAARGGRESERLRKQAARENRHQVAALLGEQS